MDGVNYTPNAMWRTTFVSYASKNFSSNNKLFTKHFVIICVFGVVFPTAGFITLDLH